MERYLSIRKKIVFGMSIYKIDELSYVLKNVHFFNNLDVNYDLRLICNPKIIDDVSHQLKISKVDIIHVEKGIPDFFTPYDEGSYRHAGNLNILIQKYAKANQIILCDPDIVFIDQDFVNKIIHLHNMGKDIVGLEWDKTIPSKWRDFPAPHFISIDTDRINTHLINLRPFLEGSFGKRKRHKKLKKIAAHVKRFKIRLLPGILTVGLLYLKKNLSSDTGYFLRDFVHRRRYSIFLIENSINHFNYLVLHKILKKGISRIIRKIPVFLKLVPNVKHYTSCLIEDNYDIYKKTRPEEMIINDVVVALHFRSVRVLNQQPEGSLNLNLDFINTTDLFSLETHKYIKNPKFKKINDV